MCGTLSSLIPGPCGTLSYSVSKFHTWPMTLQVIGLCIWLHHTRRVRLIPRPNWSFISLNKYASYPVCDSIISSRLSCGRIYMIRLLAHLLPTLPSASCLSFSVFLCVANRASWLKGGGRGAKSYDREKARPSINHWIFSSPRYFGILAWIRD